MEKELNNLEGAIGYKDIADSLQLLTQDIDTRNTMADLQSKYDSEKWQKESLQASIEKKEHSLNRFVYRLYCYIGYCIYLL